jgi:hypothetical protein
VITASLRAPSGTVAPAAFLAATAWEAFQAVEDLRRLRADPELAGGEPSLLATAATIGLVVLCLPAFVVAGHSAFGA